MCSLCHEMIGREHIEYEFAEPERARLHLRCPAVSHLAAAPERTATVLIRRKAVSGRGLWFLLEM